MQDLMPVPLEVDGDHQQSNGVAYRLIWLVNSAATYHHRLVVESAAIPRTKYLSFDWGAIATRADVSHPFILGADMTFPELGTASLESLVLFRGVANELLAWQRMMQLNQLARLPLESRPSNG